MIIKDIKTQTPWDIYKPEWIKVTYQGLDIVECVDSANGNCFTFRTGDALMAGIQIPQAKTLFDYANKDDGDDDGPDTTENSEKLT